jgi:hypothetical protein
MVFDGFRADSFFGEEFHGGEEEVMKESPFKGIEVIEERDDFGIIEALVAEPLADMGPVFLLDMGIIVFMIGAASSELNGFIPFGKVSEEVIIEKLASVVTIEAEQGERQSLFDLFNLFEGIGFSFAPDGSLFSPAGGNIDAVNGIGEHTGEGITAMGDGVGFKEAGSGFVPLVGFDGDLLS